MAVTVSSQTLEATTLVLQSDLDIVVKSSRDEVFVFAENLRTGQPWPKARILLSNGTQVFAEGETNENGVFQKSFEELKSGDDVRVFAVADGHMASNIVDLDGLEVAQGLSDKGYIYTDRPAYRPGQMVHVRGVIRKVVRRRVHGGQGQGVPRRRVRQPQSAGPRRRGGTERVRLVPRALPAHRRPPAPATIASWSTTTRTKRTTKARSPSTTTSWSRCDWRSTRRARSTIAARRSRA